MKLLQAAELAAVERQAELFLEEMTDAVPFFADEVGQEVEVSLASVSRTLSWNECLRKVIEEARFTRNEAQRAS